MRRLTTALLALVLAATACTPASDGDGDGPATGGGTADAAALVRFESCDAFGAEVRRRALEDVTPYGLEAPALATDVVAAEASVTGGAGPSAGEDFSTTNVQEEGVDEPDVVTTDGRFVYALADGMLRIVDVGRSRPTVAATLLPDDGMPRELLLHGTRLLLLGDDARPLRPPGGPSEPSEPGVMSMPVVAVRTRAWAVDVGVPAAPRVTSTMAIDGSLVTSRAVDGTARVVLRSTPQLLPLVVPGGDAPDPERAAAVNRQRIRESDAESWLPHATVDATPAEPLVACTAVHRPPEGTGTGIVSVLSLDLDQPELATDRVAAVLGAAETVYADRDSLYVTTSRWPQIQPVAPLSRPVGPLGAVPRVVEPDAVAETAPLPTGPSDAPIAPDAPTDGPIGPPIAPESTPVPDPAVTTEVHRFDLPSAGGAAYVASGSVEGTVLNQWALSEHDDHLRIATTTPAARGRRSSSAVTVLRRDADRLMEVGRVGDLGRGEQIYAVRYVGPTGFVVTFRQVDPLYTLDLSDPRRPRVLGELKIPGYSAYLHPVGDDHLLGVGQDADRRGRTRGLQVSLFDIGDLSAPARVAQLTLGPNTHSAVETDHRAFLAWPARDLLALPVEHWDEERLDVLVLESTGGQTFEERGTIEVPDGLGYRPGVVRSMVVDDRLVTVTPGVVVVTDLVTLRQLGAVAV